MLGNTENSYGFIAKSLHWVVAIAILSLLWAGYYMTDMPNSDQKFQIYGIHKAFGSYVLILVSFRIFWRLTNIVPKLPAETPRWQIIAADINTKFLYFLMICQPLSGIFMSLYSGRPINMWLFTVPAFNKKEKLAMLAKEFHEAFAVLLILSISIHLAAALYHHFVKKDGVLRRMLGSN